MIKQTWQYYYFHRNDYFLKNGSMNLSNEKVGESLGVYRLCCDLWGSAQPVRYVTLVMFQWGQSLE